MTAFEKYVAPMEPRLWFFWREACEWQYISEPNTDQEIRLLICMGESLDFASRKHYRKCRNCGHVQCLDIDGWCDNVFANDAERIKAKFL